MNLEGSLHSRRDRRGPQPIVAANVSSDSIPGVLGIVAPVESAFGGCLSCSCSKYVDAILSRYITALSPSAGSAFALLIWQ